MKWFKYLIGITMICVITLVAIDIHIYFFFSEHVQRLSPTKYKMPSACDLASAFYMPHSERGFDIKPDTRGISCYEPWESASYIAWGNSLGCFDTEKEKGYRPDIYLAGDSYTWGYAPFESKFGTILEKKTGRNILKCGVANTGQRHQFSKFLEISEKLDQLPKIVVVNYASNDMENDYVYPHSTVINNKLIEDTFLTRSKGGVFEIVRIDRDTLIANATSRQEKNKTSLFNFLRRYSASSNIMYYIINNYLEKHKKRSIPDDEERHWFYYLVLLLDDSGMQDGLPIYSVYGEENRKILLQWKEHSKENNYRLILSLIPNRWNFGENYYRNLEYFLSENGIEYYNFENYITKHNIDKTDIFWSYDSHFNIKGNAIYEDFLEEILKQ